MANSVELADTIPPVPEEISREFDFAAWQALHPNEPLPGDKVNNEFDRTDDTVNLIAERLALIQRDDGGLMNGIVHDEQLDPQVFADLEAIRDATAASAADAASSASAASASEAAAETSATDAAASEAASAAHETNAAISANDAAASASTAQSAAASVLGLVPALPGTPGAVIVVDPTGTDYTLREVVPPTTLADAGKSVVVNATGDALTLEYALLRDGTAYDAGGFPIINVTYPAAPNDAATKQFVLDSVAGAGSVPPPDGADAGKVLTANGAGVFGWTAFIAAMISDATAYMRGLLTTINDAAAFLAAIGAAPASQAVPIPANPGDDGKSLKASGGAFSWQAQTNLVPTPASPGDNLKALVANLGAYSWQAIQQVPVPVGGDAAKILTATGAGAYSWQSPADATNAVKGVIKIETAAEVAAGVDKLAALTIGEFAASKFNSIGRQTYELTAGAFAGLPSSPATAGVSGTANGQVTRWFSFADAVAQTIGLALPLPKKIDVTQAFNVRIRWGAVPTGVVRWQVSYSTGGDGDPVDVAATIVTLDAAQGVGNTIEYTAQIVCAWPAGTQKEDILFLSISRLGAHANDTLAAFAYLYDVDVAFVTDAGTDA